MSLLLLLFGCLLINWPLCYCTQVDSVQKSILRPTVERVFSRKKRWLLFPKGSNLKFTTSISKRLLAMYPRGFNFNIEAAVYFPVPRARIDLIPRRFRKPTTEAPIVKGPTPLYLIGIPGSVIKYRAKPATKPAKVQRIDQNISSLQWVTSPPSHLYLNGLQKWSKYDSTKYFKNHGWSSKYYNKSLVNSRTPSPSLKYPSNPKKLYHRSRYTRDDYNINEKISSIDDYNLEYRPIYFEDLEAFEDSPHYHSYRTRRELFHHFEGLTNVLGIDMKSCILRAICDSKQFLLPPGYSMIQDIMRVVFTFPTITGLKDDYSRIMSADYETCNAHIHTKCPFNILDWLLNSRNSI